MHSTATLTATSLQDIPQTALDIRMLNSVADIDRDIWTQLLPEGHFAKHSYMMALEQSRLDCRFSYAILYVERKAVAILIATQWPLQLPLGLGLQVMTTGTPVNTGSPLLTRDEDQRAQYLALLLPVMQQQGKRSGARLFLGRDLDKEDCRVIRDVQKLYNCAFLSLDWPDFESYLAALNKSRRKSIRRDIAAIERAGFELDVQIGELQDAEDVRQLQPLWQQLYRKHHSPDQIYLGDDYFRLIAKQPHAIWFLLRQNGRLCAFDLCFNHGDLLESTYCGLDIETCSRLPVHKVMGYEIIRYAIKHPELKVINFGISNEQTKLEAGCYFVMQYAQIRIFPSFLHKLLLPLVKRLLLAP